MRSFTQKEVQNGRALRLKPIGSPKNERNFVFDQLDVERNKVIKLDQENRNNKKSKTLTKLVLEQLNRCKYQQTLVKFEQLFRAIQYQTTLN